MLRGVRPDGAGRADRRAGGHDRRGEDHHRQADVALLRPERGRRPAGRGGPARSGRHRPAAGRRAGHPGELHLRRDGRREHRLRPARRDAARRSSRRPRRWGPTTSSTSCPRGTTPTWPSAAARLSAGQRQLVAFARAFLADPAVLILDEATSSLDVPSERLVQRALRTILADRTAVIIAHRLSTVEIADRVLVLEHGGSSRTAAPRTCWAAGDGHYAAPAPGLARARWPDPRVPSARRRHRQPPVRRAARGGRRMITTGTPSSAGGVELADGVGAAGVLGDQHVRAVIDHDRLLAGPVVRTAGSDQLPARRPRELRADRRRRTSTSRSRQGRKSARVCRPVVRNGPRVRVGRRPAPMPVSATQAQEPAAG